MRIHIFQHVPFEGPAGVARWAAERDHDLATTTLSAGAALPELDQVDWLVVLGGPMGVYDQDEHPWLVREKTFIRAAIEAGRTVVGICLGAQLIADVLGAHVYRAEEKEIGWLPVALTPEGTKSKVTGFLPERFDAFHWHGDTFEMPEGALRLAETEACANQAFLYDGRVLGLQFHLEATRESVRALTRHAAADLAPGPYVQDAATMLEADDAQYARLNQALAGILDRLPTRDTGA